ncbi:hypothetical protein [Streptococcus alactolyticus]
MISSLVVENAKVIQDQDEYQSKYQKLSSKYETIVKNIEVLEVEKLAISKRNKDLQDFISVLEKQDDLVTDFDEFLWDTFVVNVTISKDKEFIYLFKNGAVATM